MYPCVRREIVDGQDDLPSSGCERSASLWSSQWRSMSAVAIVGYKQLISCPKDESTLGWTAQATAGIALRTRRRAPNDPPARGPWKLLNPSSSSRTSADCDYSPNRFALLPATFSLRSAVWSSTSSSPSPGREARNRPSDSSSWCPQPASLNLRGATCSGGSRETRGFSNVPIETSPLGRPPLGIRRRSRGRAGSSTRPCDSLPRSRRCLANPT